MRHRCKQTLLGRAKDQHLALFRSLTRSLIFNGQIKTTLSKAKMLRSYIEPLITMARKANSNIEPPQKLHQIRKILRFVAKDCLEPLMKHASGLLERNGGYTRILKLTDRMGDARQMALIQILKN